MSDHDHLNRHSPSAGPGSPNVWGVYEAATGSVQYLAACPITNKAVLIDTVLNFDVKAARTSTESAERMLALVEENGLELDLILDTHPHADHMMASHWLRERTGRPNGIGEKTKDIAELWRGFYGLPDGLRAKDHFDRFYADDDTFAVGELAFRVMLSPGHTLGSISYVAGDAAFIHDTLMYPDAGSARADFPGGSAEDLWHSIQAILAMPGDTRLFVGHDYGRGERAERMWEATVAEHRARNIHVRDGMSKGEFIRTREERDRTLALPDRMLHALQVNLRGGALPEPEADGNSYFKIPANRF